eukprot:1197083-Karenia_brevis.AAC.1
MAMKAYIAMSRVQKTDILLIAGYVFTNIVSCWTTSKDDRALENTGRKKAEQARKTQEDIQKNNMKDTLECNN